MQNYIDIKDVKEINHEKIGNYRYKNGLITTVVQGITIAGEKHMMTFRHGDVVNVDFFKNLMSGKDYELQARDLIAAQYYRHFEKIITADGEIKNPRLDRAVN